MAITITKRFVPREIGRNGRIISGESTISNRAAVSFGQKASSSGSSGNGISGVSSGSSNPPTFMVQYSFSINTDVGVAPELHEFKDIGTELYLSIATADDTYVQGFLSSLQLGSRIVLSKSTLQSVYREMQTTGSVVVESNYIRIPYAETDSNGTISSGDTCAFSFLQSPTGIGGDHNTLTNLQLAGSGVTWGHIDDQTQTIVGTKTFSDTTSFSTVNSEVYDNTTGIFTTFRIFGTNILELGSVSSDFTTRVSGVDAVSIDDFVTLGQLNGRTHNSLGSLELASDSSSYGHLSADQWGSLMTYNFVDVIGTSGAINIDFDGKNIFWMNSFRSTESIQVTLINDSEAKKMFLRVRTYLANTTITFPPNFRALDTGDSRWTGNAFAVTGVGYYDIQATRNVFDDAWDVHVVPVNATGDHNELTNLQLAGSGVTYGHIDDQAQTIAGEKTLSSVLNIEQASNTTHAVRRDQVLLPEDFDFVDIAANSDPNISENINFRVPVTSGSIVFNLQGSTTPKFTDGYIWIDNQSPSPLNVSFNNTYIINSGTEEDTCRLEIGEDALFRYVINGTDDPYIFYEKRRTLGYKSVVGTTVILDVTRTYNFIQSVSVDTLYRFNSTLPDGASGNIIVTNTDTNPITISFNVTSGEPVYVIRGDGTSQVVMEDSSTYVFSYTIASGSIYLTYGEDYA